MENRKEHSKGLFTKARLNPTLLNPAKVFLHNMSLISVGLVSKLINKLSFLCSAIKPQSGH